jgi:molybdopterin converting factor small subunit
MVNVTVHLHTILQPNYDIEKNNIELLVQDGSTIEQLLFLLNISLTPEHLLMVVNGHLVESSYGLKENDDIHLIPAISGGCLKRKKSLL